MTLPRFHSRISNALGFVNGSPSALMSRLSATSISLEMAPALDDDPAHEAGFLFAVNLCSRLYPRIHISAPTTIREKAAELIMKINPECEIDSGQKKQRLVWGAGATPTDSVITVSAAGWTAYLDQPNQKVIKSNALTTLVAACLGVGELFRSVFGDFLPSGRQVARPAEFNLITLETAQKNLPELPTTIDIGNVYLAGAGAIGQAMLHALGQLSVRGRLTVVDPESITLSNLQRYVLAMDSDVGKSKCSVARSALKLTALEVVSVETLWGEDDRSRRRIETVAVGLDTSAARIGVQAGLPREIYNAWTQPNDLGWSRHEHFGKDPCLACLYTPSGPRPSQHELIARALRQPELRVLAYLIHRVPVDTPLKPEQIPRLQPYPIPPSAPVWSDRSILEDAIRDLGVDATAIATWRGKPIADLYREGICGGALIRERIGELPQEVAVPLPHQSGLAGVMLAAQLILARIPQFRSLRSEAMEGRFDVLAGLPQVIGRPRQRTLGCVCSDPDYIHRYEEKWHRERKNLTKPRRTKPRKLPA